VLSSMMEKISNKMGRRSFLTTITKAAAALALGIVGVPSAQAFIAVVKCCRLCQSSTSTCKGKCTWSWTCICQTGVIEGCTAADNNKRWKCLEVYNPCSQPQCPTPPGPMQNLPSPDPCGGNTCSRAIPLG